MLLSQHVRTRRPQGGDVRLLAHSTGGLIAAYYAEHLASRDQAKVRVLPAFRIFPLCVLSRGTHLQIERDEASSCKVAVARAHSLFSKSLLYAFLHFSCPDNQKENQSTSTTGCSRMRRLSSFHSPCAGCFNSSPPSSGPPTETEISNLHSYGHIKCLFISVYTS